MTFGDGLKKKKSTDCKVCNFIAAQPDDDARDKVLGFFSDPEYSHLALADEMTENGCPVSESSVKRHRLRHMGLRVSELR